MTVLGSAVGEGTLLTRVTFPPTFPYLDLALTDASIFFIKGMARVDFLSKFLVVLICCSSFYTFKVPHYPKFLANVLDPLRGIIEGLLGIFFHSMNDIVHHVGSKGESLSPHFRHHGFEDCTSC